MFLGDTNQLVAVHTGGYRVGPGRCHLRPANLPEPRLDTPVVLDWSNRLL